MGGRVWSCAACTLEVFDDVKANGPGALQK
jgi:hypothetical protein